MKKYILPIFVFLFVTALASAVTIDSVDSPSLLPGKQGELRVSIENTLDDDVQDVTFSINTANLPVTVVGSSEFGVQEIDEGDDELFAFILRASTTASAGDYSIPYSLSYSQNNVVKTRSGVLGLRIEGTVDIQPAISAENNIVGQEGTISIKLINKGFADARYVSVRIVPSGFLVTSDELVYVGDIDANDFETATFNVIYQEKNPIVQAQVEYLDFSNLRQRKSILEPIKVYTQQEAVEQGIIPKNNTPYYLGIIVLIIVLWFIYRAIKKRRRMKKSLQSSQ